MRGNYGNRRVTRARDVEKETDMVWVVLSRSEQITFLRKVTKMMEKSLLSERPLQLHSLSER
jgi:hypothetical protein